jgi:hypothetical protein
MSTSVLILRDPAKNERTPCSPASFSRPRVRFAKNVMEVKAHLLRCLDRMEAGLFALPSFVLVDAGAQDRDIKRELNRWLNERPGLHGVQVLLAAELSIAARLWSGLGRLLGFWKDDVGRTVPRTAQVI